MNNKHIKRKTSIISLLKRNVLFFNNAISFKERVKHKMNFPPFTMTGGTLSPLLRVTVYFLKNKPKKTPGNSHGKHATLHVQLSVTMCRADLWKHLTTTVRPRGLVLSPALVALLDCLFVRSGGAHLQSEQLSPSSHGPLQSVTPAGSVRADPASHICRHCERLQRLFCADTKAVSDDVAPQVLACLRCQPAAEKQTRGESSPTLCTTVFPIAFPVCKSLHLSPTGGVAVALLAARHPQ